VACLFDGLQVFDLSDPTVPTLVGAAPVGSISQDVVVAGDHAFLITSDAEDLVILDVAAPTNPVVIATLPIDGYNYEIDHRDGHAYIAGTSGLKIVDVTDPTAPSQVSVLDLGGTGWTITACDDRAYVGTSDGVHLVDVTTPATPAEIGFVATPSSVNHVAVAGSLLYATASGDGLVAVDVTDETAPVVLGCRPVGGRGYGLVLHDDRLYVADGISVMGGYSYGGVYSLPPQCDTGVAVGGADPSIPSPALTLGVHPNPFNPGTRIAFTLDRPGAASLQILDVAGRRIRTLQAGHLGAGRHVLDWRGDDDGGRPVATGVYLVVLETGDGMATRKITLAR
jgi:hypothetical protein